MNSAHICTLEFLSPGHGHAGYNNEEQVDYQDPRRLQPQVSLPNCLCHDRTSNRPAVRLVAGLRLQFLPQGQDRFSMSTGRQRAGGEEEGSPVQRGGIEPTSKGRPEVCDASHHVSPAQTQVHGKSCRGFAFPPRLCRRSTHTRTCDSPCDYVITCLPTCSALWRCYTGSQML